MAKKEMTCRLVPWILIGISILIYVSGLSENRFNGICILLLGFGLLPWPRSRTPKAPQAWNLFLVWVLFGMLVFVLHFWFFNDFGLYESDYSFVVPVFDWKWAGFIDFLRSRLLARYDEGALAELSVAFFSFVSYRLGGLDGIYFSSILIPTTSAFLFFLILRDLFKDTLAGFIGGILFIVFPPFRTPSMITSTFSSQIALACALGSFYAFLQGRKTRSFILMSLTILFSQTYLPLFFFFPLFREPSNGKPFMKRWLQYNGQVFLIAGIILLASSSSLGFLDTVHHFIRLVTLPIRFLEPFSRKAIHYLSFGFTISPSSLAIVPSRAMVIVFVIGSLIFTLLFFLSHKEMKDLEKEKYCLQNNVFSLEIHIIKKLRQYIRMVLAGLVMLVYAFVAFPRDIHLTCYNSSCSTNFLVAALPVIFLITGVVMTLLLLSRAKVIKGVILLFLSFYLALLASDRIYLQSKMIQSWRFQQWLWTNILRETEMFSEDLVLSLQPAPLEIMDPYLGDGIFIHHQINPFPLLFEIPEKWNSLPEVILNEANIPNTSAQPLIILNMRDGYLGSPMAAPQNENPNAVFYTQLENRPLYHLLIEEEFAGKSVRDVLGDPYD